MWGSEDHSGFVQKRQVTTEARGLWNLTLASDTYGILGDFIPPSNIMVELTNCKLLTSLCLSFPSWKMWIIVVPSSEGSDEN